MSCERCRKHRYNIVQDTIYGDEKVTRGDQIDVNDDTKINRSMESFERAYNLCCLL